MDAALVHLSEQIAQRRCVVVGSAPLSQPLDIHPDDYVIVANGSISSVPVGRPQLWFLNSRTRPKPTWDPTRLFLHEQMMQQCKGRSVDTVAFVLRQSNAGAVTTEWLKELECTYNHQVTVTGQSRRQIDRAVQVSNSPVPPASAGMLGVMFAIQSGAAHVKMRGFSWTAGYAYLRPDQVPPTARGHVNADKVILARYCELNPGIIDTDGLI
jgi:hypothetical protein